MVQINKQPISSIAVMIRPDIGIETQFRALFVFVAVSAICTLAIPANAQEKSGGSNNQSIVALVNDEPVTSYSVRKRQALMGLGNKQVTKIAQSKFKSLLKRKSVSDDLKRMLRKTVDQNKGKTRDQIIAIFEKKKKNYAIGLQKRAVDSARKSVLSGLYKKALNQLIDERLQLQEAKRKNVLASDDDVRKTIVKIAGRNKLDEKQFAKYLKSIGSDIHSMRAQIKATLSWRNVVRQQFGRINHFSSRDIDRWTDRSSVGDDAPANASLKLQRITFALGGDIKDADFARLLRRADALRKRHTGCNATPSLVQTEAGARFEDLGTRPAGSIAEPTRTMLLNATPGEMLPANVAASGVELWVLCDKQTTASGAGGADAGPGPSPGGRRVTASDKAKQKDFELLSKRKLNDMRQDAHIEYR